MSLIINGFVFNKLLQWQVDYLIQNYQQQKLSDLTQTLGMCDETIFRLLKALNLKRERHFYRVLPSTQAVNEDLANPYLSHVKIAKKYNTTPDVVAQRRKRKGLSVRRNVGRTLLEEEIISILTKMDIVFLEQKRIGKWSIDFYLGNKICLDVHGAWAHTKELVKERDINKHIELQAWGYQYIVIWESEIEQAEKIIRKNIKEYFTWL